MIDALSQHAADAGRRLRVHIELESGLNRNGLPVEALVTLAERARELPGIEVEGVYTHLAAAEEGDAPYTRAQFDMLEEASQRLPWIRERHISASASLLLSPDMKLDAVRAGLAVYGYHPAPEQADGDDLRRVLSLKARIMRVVDVPPGATVGYGRTWTAERPSRIALIMCGYADGLPRALSNRASVLVHGQRAPIAGRIAMDMCMADVTAVDGVAAGDEAVIIGTQAGASGDETIDADDLATLAGTISWEILAGISARVPRWYLRGGRPVARTTLNERTPVPVEGAAALR
jgi:alanine racemase